MKRLCWHWLSNPALSRRPASKQKHIKWALDKLLSAADDLLNWPEANGGNAERSRCGARAGIKRSAPETDLWEVVVPTVKAALEEAADQAAMDREEIETLWWLFAAYSETEQKAAGRTLAVCCRILLPLSNWQNRLYCRRLSVRRLW